MAISPPSDILLDVAGAADPAKVREATARLARLAANPMAGNEGFSAALTAAGLDPKAAGVTAARTRASLPISPPTGLRQMASGPSVVRASQDPGETYRKFEAVLLQGFVESMLPKDDALYGDKTSAGVYRSMMAEQLAGQISRAGGIGLAKAIQAAHPAGGGAVKPATADPA